MVFVSQKAIKDVVSAKKARHDVGPWLMLMLGETLGPFSGLHLLMKEKLVNSIEEAHSRCLPWDWALEIQR